MLGKNGPGGMGIFKLTLSKWANWTFLWPLSGSGWKPWRAETWLGGKGWKLGSGQQGLVEGSPQHRPYPLSPPKDRNAETWKGKPVPPCLSISQLHIQIIEIALLLELAGQGRVPPATRQYHPLGSRQRKCMLFSTRLKSVHFCRLMPCLCQLAVCHLPRKHQVPTPTNKHIHTLYHSVQGEMEIFSDPCKEWSNLWRRG